MIASAHQPHFLPWLGYFDKIRRSDVFVLLDHVQFERRNYQNRTRIKTRAGERWLTVPVHQRSRAERIIEKEIDNAPDGKLPWGEKMIRTIENSYGKARYWGAHRGFFEDALLRPWTRLVDLNDALLTYLLAQLDVRTPVVRSSSLGHIPGARGEMILNLCRAVGAHTYLSGSGGSRAYVDVDLFERAGVQVVWQDFAHPGYPQLKPPDDFIPGLSVLDLLFNCGPESGAILRGKAAAAPKAARGRSAELPPGEMSLQEAG